MSRYRLTLGALSCVLAMAGVPMSDAGEKAAATAAPQYDGQELAKDATVSMEQASALALKARPGEITDRELEREDGGSGLRYSFDIKSEGVTYEVGVDAKTGKILENAKEGPNPD